MASKGKVGANIILKVEGFRIQLLLYFDLLCTSYFPSQTIVKYLSTPQNTCPNEGWFVSQFKKSTLLKYCACKTLAINESGNWIILYPCLASKT